MYREDTFNVVLPALFLSAPKHFSRLEFGSVKACFLTMREAEVWEVSRFLAGSVACSWFRQTGIIASHPHSAYAGR
jgi:hypothetical protein